ncbi:MAG: polar development protein PodJ [Frankiales bacterium]|nr:polar development protein PodJ [Frankiales bacterium]
MIPANINVLGSKVASSRFSLQNCTLAPITWRMKIKSFADALRRGNRAARLDRGASACLFVLMLVASWAFLTATASHAADATTSWVRKDARGLFGAATDDPYLNRVRDMPVEQLRQLHEAGELDATIQLAKVLWWDGDTEGPISLLQKPAEMGIPYAQYLLGSYLRFKNRDVPGALTWIGKASEAGHPLAQETLAGFHSIGTYGIPVDDKRAFELYLLAAKQGLKHSQMNVGIMLCSGTGTQQNKAEGRKWFLLSQKGQKASFSLRDAGCN